VLFADSDPLLTVVLEVGKKAHLIHIMDNNFNPNSETIQDRANGHLAPLRSIVVFDRQVNHTHTRDSEGDYPGRLYSESYGPLLSGACIMSIASRR
jgi:hypothetical protein